MKAKITKRVGVILIALTIFSLISCSQIDQQQAEDIESLLQEKYQIEFKVKAIGGRYGTVNNDSVTTYVNPVGNESLVFIAEMSKDGVLLADSFIPQKMSEALNQVLKENLKAEGITSETLAVVMNANSSSERNREITLDEYVTTYKPGYFSADMIVKETSNLTTTQFEKALTAVYEAGLGTKFQVAIHVISKEQYEECLGKFKELPMVSDAWFIDYNVVDVMKLSIDSNGFQVFQSNAHSNRDDG